MKLFNLMTDIGERPGIKKETEQEYIAYGKIHAQGAIL